MANEEQSLDEFIRDIESRYFRTPFDWGANTNSMLIWNLTRQFAGMEKLTMDDLVMKYYVGEQGMTPDDARAKYKETREWLRNNNK